jgi:hypothetical protein
MPEAGGQPLTRIRAGREPGARGIPRCLAGLAAQPDRGRYHSLHLRVRGHGALVPNSTPSVSGR